VGRRGWCFSKAARGEAEKRTGVKASECVKSAAETPAAGSAHENKARENPKKGVGVNFVFSFLFAPVFSCVFNSRALFHVLCFTRRHGAYYFYFLFYFFIYINNK